MFPSSFSWILPLKLFDDIERADESLMLRCEPYFAFINRTSRPGAELIREAAEIWFNHYPAEKQADLRIRFRSGIDREHHAAAFEIILHEVLLQVGCSIEIEPELPNGSYRHPDFLVTTPDGNRFYLEATVVTAKTPEEQAAEERVNRVYDAIDRLDSPNFFLGVDVDGAPRSSVPSKQMRGYLLRRLAELDPDLVIAAYQGGGESALPRWEWSHDGWVVKFFPIPKSPEARGKTGVRPLGLVANGGGWVQTAAHMRDSLVDKAGRYGELELPYVVAVNVLDHIDRIDIEEALFGAECVTVRVYAERVETMPDRTPDGLWTSRRGPRYTRVSAVLVTNELHISSCGTGNVALWHNPWAERPYDSVLVEFPQYVPIDRQMVRREGRALADMLGLPAVWPWYMRNVHRPGDAADMPA